MLLVQSQKDHLAISNPVPATYEIFTNFNKVNDQHAEDSLIRAECINIFSNIERYKKVNSTSHICCSEKIISLLLLTVRILYLACVGK